VDAALYGDEEDQDAAEIAAQRQQLEEELEAERAEDLRELLDAETDPVQAELLLKEHPEAREAAGQWYLRDFDRERSGAVFYLTVPKLAGGGVDMEEYGSGPNWGEIDPELIEPEEFAAIVDLYE
jgi:hypothetical protein